MPRRRKQSSSAFEFTGEEAIAAERAFQRRNAKTSRKPKISVTSISPLSTINKLLRRHNSKTTPSTTAAPPNKHPSLPNANPQPLASPPTTPQTPNPVTSPASYPSPTTAPSRRSLRQRLPSFKLRPTRSRKAHIHPAQSSEPVPARVRIRKSPKSSQRPPMDAPNDQSEKLFSSNVPIGQPDALRKRPRDPCDRGDDADMTVVPQVKKHRLDGGRDGGAESGDDAEVTRGTKSQGVETPAEGIAVVTAGAEHPTGHEKGIENQHRNESGVPVKTAQQLNTDSTGENVTKGASGTEDHPEHAMEIDQKGGGTEKKDTESMDRHGEDTPATDPSAEEENPSAELTDPKPCAEEKLSAEDIIAIDAKASTEEKQSTKANPADGTSPSREENVSGEASPSPVCATPESKNPFESPVTPLKADDDGHMPDNPSDPLPTNQQPRDSSHQENLHASQVDRNENAVSVLPVSAETTPVEPVAPPTDGSLGTEAKQLQNDEEVITEGSSPNLSERAPTSTLTTVEKNADTKADTLSNSDSKPKSDQPSPGPIPKDEIKEETAIPKDGVEVVAPNKPKSPTLPAKVERSSPAKTSSGVMKRVRFTEPSPTYRSSERKLGFSGIVKMRRRRVRKHRALDAEFGDVSVAAAGTKGPDEKGRQLLLDELQYLLDGIFKTSTNGSKKGGTADNQVVASSLQSLIKLLLRKSKTASQRNEEEQEDDSGLLVQILVEQPDLLKTIVKRLCTVLGKSKASDALLALVFVIILRATPKILLLTEYELDLLLNAFFRNSAVSLKESERDAQKPDDTKDTTDKEPQGRRRGKLGRMFDQKGKQNDEILTPLLKLMTNAEVIEDHCNAFKRETDAASHLLGLAISFILRNEIETRAWMRDNRRLDKVVAVVYSCEKMMLSQAAKENDQHQQPVSSIEQGASWIVMEASVRVLEFAVLDPVCQQRLALESRVSAIIIHLLKTINSIRTGPLESEWMICAALRLCINLCHGCDVASKQLVDGNGQNVVLNWLVKECLSAGLLQKDITRELPADVEESFDVRVLCLAVLASTVNQEMSVCNSFREMQGEGVEKRESGAISLILEILRTAELEAKEESKENNDDDIEEGLRRRKKTTREEEAERERRAQFVMERKITIGYVCLLIGALACDSKSNRELMQDLLPGKSFIGVAAVLAEFLQFHHEVGVISGSMNRMYAEIIKKIVEPEAAKDVGILETECDGTGEELQVDTEGHCEDLDFLLDAPDDGAKEDGADESTELGNGLVASGCEEATLATPVDGAV